MVKYFFFFSCIMVFSLNMAAQATGNTKKPLLSYKERHINLGKVKKGNKVTFSYTFTNTSKQDVEIDIVTGCDCTEATWPSKKIKPGESGKIDVVFLSAKKEKSETVELDVILKNEDPKTGYPIFDILSYSYLF
ncbi:MAG TPA: hypothetical protein DCX89_03280 [Saprospirales bacterium]|nr:hypothetical protein [Saprospirales bacterium]HRQ29607.1 DUF1573 domain-containing protein [Saprospiraceae bacterium]